VPGPMCGAQYSKDRGEVKYLNSRYPSECRLFILWRLLGLVSAWRALGDAFFLAVQLFDEGEGFREDLIAFGLAAAVVAAVVFSSAKISIADAFNHVGFDIRSAHGLLSPGVL